MEFWQALSAVFCVLWAIVFAVALVVIAWSISESRGVRDERQPTKPNRNKGMRE